MGKTKHTLYCLIGLSALFAMFRAPFFGTLITGVESSFSILRIAYDGSILLISILLGICSQLSLKNQSLKHLIENITLNRYALIGTFAVLGVTAISVGKVQLIDSYSFYIVFIAALSIGFTSLIAGWFKVLMCVPRESIASIVTFAFVLSHVFGVLDIFPRTLASFLSALYPLIAISMMICLNKVINTENAASNSKTESLLQNSYLKKVQVCTMLLIFAEVLCGAFLRSKWAHGGINYNPTSYVFWSYVVSLIIGLIFFVIANRAKTTADSTLGVGSIGLIGFVTATFLFSFSTFFLYVTFVTGLYSALLVFLIALIALRGIDGGYSNFACTAIFLGMFGFASAITSSIIPAILVYLNMTPSDVLIPVGILAGLIISAGTCIALFMMTVAHRASYKENYEHVLQTSPASVTVPDINFDAHARAMDKIAAEFTLTEREKETASLMARGYTVKRVAEELVVADSTIKGYSKSIYRKMNIHRKDELIALVNDRKNNYSS